MGNALYEDWEYSSPTNPGLGTFRGKMHEALVPLLVSGPGARPRGKDATIANHPPQILNTVNNHPSLCPFDSLGEGAQFML